MLRVSSGTYFSAKRPRRQFPTRGRQNLTLANGVREYRVGGGNARANNKRFEEREVGNEGPNKKGGNEPGACHHRDEEDEQTKFLPPAVGLRQRDTGEQNLDSDDDARDLERKSLKTVLIVAYPAERVENVCTDGAEGDADE